jgi:pimeloyl-ACP methyl ester carboxylesterase
MTRTSLMLALLMTTSAAAALAAPGGPRCADVSFSVTLSPADSQTYHVAGELCAEGGLQHKTFQLALHGATYSHTYWDWPFEPEIYSYMRYATAAGYAVLSIDRIGVGASDHPPADAVDIAANAYVAHQIIQDLRGGNLIVPSFGRVRAERVALVGHSLGSLISIQEAATFGDVDGVVLTGASHTVTAALGEVSFYPASLDPRFAASDLPDDYFTTVPGTRGIFYHAPFYDPRVLAVDEATKETATLAELNTAVAALSLSGGIHTPVLVMVGDDDAAFCNPPSCSVSHSLDGEPAFYPADACAEAVAIPGSGHSLNLHYQAPFAFVTILGWMDLHIGSNSALPPPVRCRP